MVSIDYRHVYVDVAVVGSGVAGLTTVYFLDTFSRGRGLSPSIALVSKSAVGYGTSTYYSAGAFRCPVGGYTVEEYVRDVMTSGRFVNREHLVRLVASEATDTVTALSILGLRFTQSRGMLRVVSEDPLFPGKEVVTVLRKYVMSRGRTAVLENTAVLEVVRVPEGFYTVCLGGDGRWYAVVSEVVVLATGGASNAYVRSDNPQQLSCDGHGIALRLGIPLIDMEFIQFFPLGLAEPGRPSLMVPFMRGMLVNRLGEDLLAKYGLGDLSRAVIYSRDELSKAMMLEVLKGSDVDGALHLYPESEGELSRYGYEVVRRLGLRSPIRVLPTAHYSMGGVEVDDRLETGIEGLYAVGELVGGIHGANRVGGNALTACTVTAKAVAARVVEYLATGGGERPRGVDEAVLKDVVSSYGLRGGRYVPNEVRARVRELMWSKVGVLRVREDITEFINEVSRYLEELEGIRVRDRREVVGYAEVLNTLLTSLAIAYSALMRTESRGSHFRLDYPEEDPKWIKNVRVRYSKGGFRVEVLPAGMG